MDQRKANDTVIEWLGAYHDGELTGERRAWVEAHLATCGECQRELAGLRALSSLLQEDPMPQPAQSAEAFASQVVRQLPPSKQPLGRRLLYGGLRHTPLVVFAGWAFLQAVIWVSSGLLLVIQFLPGAQSVFSFLLPLSPGETGSLFDWLVGMLFPLDMTVVFGTLAQLPWLNPLALIEIVLAASSAVLFLAWLAGWWSYHQMQSESNM